MWQRLHFTLCYSQSFVSKEQKRTLSNQQNLSLSEGFEELMGWWKILKVGFETGRKKGQSEEELFGQETEVTPHSS